MRRKRKHISIRDVAASALADKLSQDERNRLRGARVDADVVLRLFTPDHIHLHSFGGSNDWWNLDMRRRGPELKAKDAADTAIAAKAVRIDRDLAEFRARLLAKQTGVGPPVERPKRRIPSRPFARQRRPLRER